MPIDTITLARMQFGMTASFHILFPSLIIGLALYLTAVEACWLYTRKQLYLDQFQFWIKPFAAAFLIGLITGLVLSYQLDTIFGGLYQQTKIFLMPIREFELMNAVILEAGCFGIMVWGRNKVGERLHFVATVVVTLGVMISCVCILMRNSWMQTPVGATQVAGHLVFDDRPAALLSPSFPYRLVHVIGGACLSTAFFVLGISAWYLLRRCHLRFANYSLRFALIVIGVTAPLQFVSGDLHGLNTKQHQPAKIAAIEGLWDTTRGAPLVLFGQPDAQHERNRHTVEVPRLASILLTHEMNGTVKGLKAFPQAERPNVPLIFYSFRIMVAMGLLMLIVPAVWFIVLRSRLRSSNRWFLWACCAMLPSGFIATIAGWCVTEAGRQPWAIFGLVRTVDIIDATRLAHIDHAFFCIRIAYTIIFVSFVGFLWRVIARGPAAARNPRSVWYAQQDNQNNLLHGPLYNDRVLAD